MKVRFQQLNMKLKHFLIASAIFCTTLYSQDKKFHTKVNKDIENIDLSADYVRIINSEHTQKMVRKLYDIAVVEIIGIDAV